MGNIKMGVVQCCPSMDMCKNNRTIGSRIEDHIIRLNDEEENLKSKIIQFNRGDKNKRYIEELISVSLMNRIGLIYTNVAEVNCHLKQVIGNIDNEEKFLELELKYSPVLNEF